jgi:hypothetical protein
MAVTANDSAKDFIMAARTVQDILDKAAEDREAKASDSRLEYHMVVNFITKRSRIVISAPSPLGALGSYLFTHLRNTTLSRSLLIRKEIDGKKPHRWHQHCRHH